MGRVGRPSKVGVRNGARNETTSDVSAHLNLPARGSVEEVRDTAGRTD